MEITLTPAAKLAVSQYLELKKDRILSGHVSIFDRMSTDEIAQRIVELVIAANPDTTGLSAMNADIEAIKAQDDEEMAHHREALALDADLHLNSGKAPKAHLAQTLQAMRLERKYEVLA